MNMSLDSELLNLEKVFLLQKHVEDILKVIKKIKKLFNYNYLFQEIFY